MPDLGLVSPTLLMWGALLVSVPVLIHLLMRRQPTQAEFPTLRFLRAAEQRRSRSVKFQHLLLLLLRALLVLLVGLAFARPQVVWHDSTLTGDEPADVVLLVDTSASMAARVGGTTLLERAQVYGRSLFEALPDGSRVALLAGSAGAAHWTPAPEALAGQLSALRITPGVALRPGVEQAREVLSRVADRRRALVLLTDLTRTALPAGLLRAWPDEIPVVVVDLAGQPLDNAGLSDLRLSPPAVLPGAPVRLQGTLTSYGRAGPATLLLRAAGRTVETRRLTLPERGSAAFEMVLRPSTPGVLQGDVSLVEGDVLAADDRLFFSLKVEPPLPVLVVATPTFETGPGWAVLRLALDPEERGKRLATERLSPSQLGGRDLSAHRVAILPDVGGLDEAAWAALERFVAAGGGLLALPGPGITLDDWRRPAAARVLGAELVGPEPLVEAAGLTDVRWTHPLLARFALGRNGDLGGARWQHVARLAPAEGATSLASYGAKLPALLEHAIGRGRVLTLAGGVDPAWGELWKHPSCVPFLGELLKYLGQLSSPALNHEAGATARLPLPAGARKAQLAGPGGAARLLTFTPTATTVDCPLEDGPGHYRVLIEAKGGLREGGLSANRSAAESDLERLDPDGLARHLGRPDLQLVRADSDAGALAAGRSVSELAPLLVICVLALCSLESYVSTLRLR